MKNGMFRVASAIPSVHVADPMYNAEQICALVDKAAKQGVSLLVFPELCLTGCSCQDLFRQQQLLIGAQEAMLGILDHSEGNPLSFIVGVPVSAEGKVYNLAVVITNGYIDGIVAKTLIGNRSGYDQRRWFASASDIREHDILFSGQTVQLTAQPQIFRHPNGNTFAIEIGDDMWAPTPVGNKLCSIGADVLVIPAACHELVERHRNIKNMLTHHSATWHVGCVYSNVGFGESTQDFVYGGSAFIYENGELLAESQRFQLDEQLVVADIDLEILRQERDSHQIIGNEPARCPVIVRDCYTHIGVESEDMLAESLGPVLRRPLKTNPFLPKEDDRDNTFEEILNIQAMGLVQRMRHIHCSKAVIGISGGLDSTLALLVAVRAFDMMQLDRNGIIGITMPGFGTSGRTHNNALELMEKLGVSQREISIAKAVEQHFADIGQDMAKHDVTYENAQARERTQILMDVANMEGAIVVGTGDMSELALGWATYNGDHMSMYGVNAGVPKTLVRHLVKHIAAHDTALEALLTDIVDTPISPELLPSNEKTGKGQETEDLVGPYELHDFFLFYVMRYGFSPRKVFFLAQQAFAQEPHYDDATLKKWLTVFYRRFFSQQFKRSCLPDGPKVGSVGLSPRGDWMMPSDATATLWMKECESL